MKIEDWIGDAVVILLCCLIGGIAGVVIYQIAQP